MFIKTVSTTSGINPIKFDETGGVFYWILNTGSSTIYASTKSAFTAGDDGVVSLGPKESRRLETNNDTIYILGEGQVEIHNQRDGICSFKQAPTSSGGGGTVDAYSKTESDAKYAQKADIPTSLPANGGNADYATNAGNADKLDGKHASDFADNIYKGYPGGGDCNNATTQGVYSVSSSSQNAPDANYYLLSVDVAGDGAWMVQTANPVNFESKVYRRMYVNGVWGAWYNLTPIKKITFPSVAINAGGGGALFLSDFGTPITIACTTRADTQCTLFFSASQWLVLAKDAATLDPIPSGSYTFEVWYI